MYGKVFTQLYSSTLATKGPWQAMALWPHLIALADKDGCVDMPMEILSRMTTIPMDVVRPAMEALMAPDPDSRSQECEGRRLVPIDPDRNWGWRLVNYEAYAKIRSEQERREYQADWKRRKVDSSRQQSTKSTHIDTDIDTKQPVCSAHEEDGFDAFWRLYPSSPRKVNKAGCLVTWKSKMLDRHVDEVLAGLDAWKRFEGWKRPGPTNIIPLPKTFLNQDRWKTPPAPASTNLYPDAI